MGDNGVANIRQDAVQLSRIQTRPGWAYALVAEYHGSGDVSLVIIEKPLGTGNQPSEHSETLPQPDGDCSTQFATVYRPFGRVIIVGAGLGGRGRTGGGLRCERLLNEADISGGA